MFVRTEHIRGEKGLETEEVVPSVSREATLSEDSDISIGDSMVTISYKKFAGKATANTIFSASDDEDGRISETEAPRRTRHTRKTND